MSCSDTGFFGLNQGMHHAINDIEPWLLLNLGAELRNVSTRFWKSVDESPVRKGYFDLYFHNFLAPDQLLTGINKHLIEVCFLHLEDKAKQEQLNIALQVSMKFLELSHTPSLSILPQRKVIKCKCQQYTTFRQHCILFASLWDYSLTLLSMTHFR